jgi:hypothetical protein
MLLPAQKRLTDVFYYCLHMIQSDMQQFRIQLRLSDSFLFVCPAPGFVRWIVPTSIIKPKGPMPNLIGIDPELIQI